MAAGNGKNNIVVKKIKKVSGGHHGGAWKVAYADFVTAMMAFFLLMWLLNASEAENLAGLADYFAPTVGIKDEMGIGFRGGKSVLSEGIGADKNTNKGVVFGGVPTGPITKVTEKIEERTDEPDSEQIKIIIDKTLQETKDESQVESNDAQTESNKAKEEQLTEVQQAVQSYVEEMVTSKRIDAGAIDVKRTPEGIKIEIKDTDEGSMFAENSAELTEVMKEALGDITAILKNIPNNLAIIGHTSSIPVQGKGRDYSKWELSADRANATRSFIEKSGVVAEQISRIEGRADNLPYDPRRPEAPVNNRMDILILKNNDTPSHKLSAPTSIKLNTKEYLEMRTKQNEPKKPAKVKSDVAKEHE